MGRGIAIVALVLLAAPCQARTYFADGGAPPSWAAELEERVMLAAIQELQPEGIEFTTETVPLARTGLEGHEAAMCRAIRFHADPSGAHFTEILLCRWRPMSVTVPPPGSIQLVAPLWTVAETAVVFGPWPGPDGVAAEAALVERVTAVAGTALDVEALQTPCTEDPALPEGVQLIEGECHRHYISLQVALPGSRVPTDDELRSMAPDKMIELWLMPDRGEVIHRWIAPPLFGVDPEFAGPGPFDDYAPKDTPDTMLDYRGELAPRLAELPPETLTALPELVLLLRRQGREALKHQPEFVDGNVLLGANESQYVPSDEHLMLMAIGQRTARVVDAHTPKEVRKTLRKAGVEVEELCYGIYEFRHVDVMGSGRFFYAEPAGTDCIQFP